MFSKDELDQIRGVVQDETRKIVQEETKKIVGEELAPVKRDIKVLKTDVAKIRKDVSTVVNYFDREYMELRQRIENTESHLGITCLSN